MHEEPAIHDQARPAIVKAFIRRHRDEILAEWRRLAEELHERRQLHAATLVDHIPDLIDEIADIAEDLAAHRDPPRDFETARDHALDRLDAGFDISAVVAELSLLRHCALAVWEREYGGASIVELRALDLAIDRAVGASVTRYAEARERTLSGIDRVSAVSLESQDVDELLERLLMVFIETTPGVDTAAILLVEQDHLVVRAAVGLEGTALHGLSIPLGEGFEGRVATERRPIELSANRTEPALASKLVRQREVLALYGVPLIRGDRVIGVAHMGSLTAREFSRADRQFFGSMAARATAGIVHQLLREELAESEAHARRLAEERQLALRLREELLAVVSHDLRGPLGTIQLSATALHGLLDGEQRVRRHLDLIHRSCTRMENLIDDLLDSAKIRAGRLQLELRREQAVDIVGEALELLRPAAEEKGLQLRRASHVDGIEIACDRDRILQVFGNLIGNAIKFCRAGDAITVAADRAGAEVVFSVADTGPGIPAELVHRLFEAYWSDPGQSKHGTGLGLYIVRGIVEAHGGRVWVESRPEAGSTFFFTLPIARDEPPP